MLIGASAEFGLNVMLRHLEGRAAHGPIVARSTVMAVALNGCLAMIGFGSLMIASYRGVFSLGLLLTIDAGCNLVASLVVLPVMLRLMRRRAAPTSTPHGQSSAISRELRIMDSKCPTSERLPCWHGMSSGGQDL
jgi:uncharacterized membrane protein YdfJ with MMPL/SSD domain